MKLTFDVPDEYADGIRQVMNEVLAGLKEPEFPQKGDLYWYIGSNGSICNNFYTGIGIDKRRLDFGNCFKTKEDTEFKLEQLKVLRELEQLADDDQPWNGRHDHYYIYYDTEDNGIKISCDSYYIITSYYFKSEKSALAAIDSIGKDRLMKYYFQVPEEKK